MKLEQDNFPLVVTAMVVVFVAAFTLRTPPAENKIETASPPSAVVNRELVTVANSVLCDTKEQLIKLADAAAIKDNGPWSLAINSGKCTILDGGWHAEHLTGVFNQQLRIKTPTGVVIGWAQMEATK
jgi:hypothetical protein